jgi:cob(I)alamin adenosyltransferase
MHIYTKTGDSGSTSLYGGRRIAKSDCILGSYGEIDELSSVLGWVRAGKLLEEDNELLLRIQYNLHTIMAILAGNTKTSDKELSITIQTMERTIDRLEEKLPSLKKFIIPAGGECSSRFHIARTITRRAERTLVSNTSNAIMLQYMNRLSDLLFMLARKYANTEQTINSI